MIFGTVGSHPTFRFDRLLLALESIEGEELVVQYGPGTPPANAAVAIPWMPFDEVMENVKRATWVVGHAGVGTILCANQAGQVPIVFPRLARFGETVDDHQLDLAQKLARAGRVLLVEDAAALGRALVEAPPRGPPGRGGGEELIAAVRAELHRSSSR